MNQMLTTKRKEPWVVVAAHELHRIQEKWGIRSRRSLANTLHINARTLAKLDIRHPDKTLSVGSVIRIFNSLIFLAAYESRLVKDQEENRRMVTESYLKVLLHIEPIPSALFIDLLSQNKSVVHASF